MHIAELSAVLHLKQLTIAAKVTKDPHSLPPSIKMGKKHLWLPATVMSWLESKQSFSHEAEAEVDVFKPMKKMPLPVKISDGVKRSVGRPRKSAYLNK